MFLPNPDSLTLALNGPPSYKAPILYFGGYPMKFFACALILMSSSAVANAKCSEMTAAMNYLAGHLQTSAMLIDNLGWKNTSRSEDLNQEVLGSYEKDGVTQDCIFSVRAESCYVRGMTCQARR